jgi:GAF domain-containing protein
MASAIRERRPVWVDDVASSHEINEVSRRDLLSRNRGAVLFVPFVRDGDCVGAISVSRTEPYRFSERQVALLKTFADQAVIAIENMRMFNETKEALEHADSAISEVLRVISSSPADVQPVLEAVAVRAAKICDASDARIALVEGDHIRHAAGFGDLPPTREHVPLERGAPIGRAVIDPGHRLHYGHPG